MVYVGHSQGTTQWFVANALDKGLARHFKAFVALAPVLYVGHSESIAARTLDILKIPDLMY